MTRKEELKGKFKSFKVPGSDGVHVSSGSFGALQSHPPERRAAVLADQLWVAENRGDPEFLKKNL